jgi:hypothetical protein
MPAPAKQRVRPVVYPDTDHMGEHEIQRFIAELLRPMIARYLAARQVVAHAGADTFLYYVEGDPFARVAPAVYVVPGVPQEIAVGSYKTWIVGPPSFALEVVTSDALKDYIENPVAYAAMGAKELVLFDPEAKRSSQRRRRFTLYRRADAGFLRVEETHEDRVFSESLGCFLRSIGEGPERRVRLGLGPHGDELFPTEAESLATMTAARDEAAAENARLRAELEALRRRP